MIKITSISTIEDKSLLNCFDCSSDALNEYIVRYAQKNDRLGIGKTFVASDTEQNKIVGYFTLSNAQVKFSELPESFKSLPKYSIPAVRIARLAVSKEYQKKGYGKALLRSAFEKILAAGEITGIYIVIVDAKKDAVSFYKKYGFTPFMDKPETLFIPLETIRMAKRVCCDL